MTPIRHPSLSSKIARDALDHVTASIYDGVYATIDNLASLHDGLAAVRANADPMQTAEANAIAYKRRYDAANEQAQTFLQTRVPPLPIIKPRSSPMYTPRPSRASASVSAERRA
jgi:hypothetical protein